jgi:hypothetical protein
LSRFATTLIETAMIAVPKTKRKERVLDHRCRISLRLIWVSDTWYVIPTVNAM